ncbi:MAG TPA: hypothetical protein VFP12_12490 [Allosphingosinicella sp.]|nr:hypothetical protein [Allosphingosinicella sp.]
MRKLMATLSLGAAALTVGAGQAGAQSGTPVYTTIYFSDATYSIQVGIVRGLCTYSGVQYTLEGSHSPHFTKQIASYCVEAGGEAAG